MRCYTLDNGRVTEGVALLQEPGKTLVHVRPATWWPVREDLLSHPGVVLVDGKPVMMRASVEMIAGPIPQFIPESENDDGSTILVVGHIGVEIADWSGLTLPEPFFGKFGLNFCTGQLWNSERIVRSGDGQPLQHEEYSFCVAMRSGDRIDARMFCYRANNERRWNDPAVGGTFLRCVDGVPQFAQLRAERT